MSSTVAQTRTQRAMEPRATGAKLNKPPARSQLPASGFRQLKRSSSSSVGSRSRNRSSSRTSCSGQISAPRSSSRSFGPQTSRPQWGRSSSSSSRSRSRRHSLAGRISIRRQAARPSCSRRRPQQASAPSSSSISSSQPPPAGRKERAPRQRLLPLQTQPANKCPSTTQAGRSCGIW